MQLEDNYSLLQDNVISVLRNFPRFLTLLKCIAPRFNNLQDIANYLCENTKISTAQGIWLDYIAWLVGTTRETYDILQYFCVNQTGYFTYYSWINGDNIIYTLSATPEINDKVFDNTDDTVIDTVSATSENEITVSGINYTRDGSGDVRKPSGDLNVKKLFYFEGSSSIEAGSLQDKYLRKKIRAKIAYNTSNATRNENIKIIQGMVNAERVVITNVSPMVLDIALYGENIFYPSLESLRTSIENILGNGVGIRNLTIL
jgi:hypothetical protein